MQIFALVLSQSHLSPQDDSDDEPPTAKRTHGRSDTLELIDFSCEEGEETASSEVHSEVSHSPLSYDFGKSVIYKHLRSFFWGEDFKQFPVFNLFRTMKWMAVNWIPPMMRKSGIVTAQGIKFYRQESHSIGKSFFEFV